VYFVTLCIENRSCLFGGVNEGVLESHTSGLMVGSWWHTIPMRYPSTEAADVVVMPNHLHGLIALGTDPRQEKTPSLSRVVGWFKSITTTDYRRGVEQYGWPRFPGTLWQEGFYDHIVRTEAARRRIERYIAANPANWTQDEFHPDHNRRLEGLPARPRRGGAHQVIHPLSGEPGHPCPGASSPAAQGSRSRQHKSPPAT
jgi:REP element-mobilizing transposase RayT